jgi:hypothetical protein
MIAISKHPVKIALLLVAAILIVQSGRMIIAKARAQSAVIVPHTVVLDEVISGKDGHQHLGPRQTWALRGDGSTVVLLGKSRIIHFSSGVRVVTNDVLRRKSSIRVPTLLSPVLDPNQQCARTITGQDAVKNYTVMGEQTVDSFRAVHIITGATNSWHALDLGCARVKQTVDFGGGGASELRLVVLVPGEPEASLFELPADYEEGPPSRLVSQRCDFGTCDEEKVKQHFAARDEAYYRQRVQ